MSESWEVEVSVDGENILSIGSGCLAGVDNIDDYKKDVIRAGESLLSFIGHPRPSQWISVEDRLPDDLEGDYSVIVYYPDTESIETLHVQDIMHPAGAYFSHWMLPQPPGAE